jgi:hypothetical protein
MKSNLPSYWIDIVWIRIVSLWVSFNPCEYGCQQDRNEREERRSCAQLRQSIESSRKRAEPANYCRNNRENYGTFAVVADGVEIFGPDKPLQTLMPFSTFV